MVARLITAGLTQVQVATWEGQTATLTWAVGDFTAQEALGLSVLRLAP